MKVFISVDIEGVNGIVSWDETTTSKSEYQPFRLQMNMEAKHAVLGALNAGAKEVFVKDAHDSAKNLDINLLPEEVVLHRGWQGTPGSMMAGLDSSFDAVLFVGYHSAAGVSGNTLSHTMNTRLVYVKINDQIASEFTINSLYASYLGVPIAFLSGDEELTKAVKRVNSNIETVATKNGVGGATVSKHPNITNKEIKETVQRALTSDLKSKLISLPKNFKVEIRYRNHVDAYNSSFFPGCKLIDDFTVGFESDNYYDVLVMFKFVL